MIVQIMLESCWNFLRVFIQFEVPITQLAWFLKWIIGITSRLQGWPCNSNSDRLTAVADWPRCLLNGGCYCVCSYSFCLKEFLKSGQQDYLPSEMLPLSPLLLLVFPAALFVVAQGAGDLQGFTFPGGSAGFDPTGITEEPMYIGKLYISSHSYSCIFSNMHCHSQ